MKIYFERLGPKLPRYYMQIMLIVILLFSMTISAAAAEDMWEAADRIIKDVYTKIAGISTVLAGLMSAVAVVGAKVSNNQHKTDQAWDWLKRIWLCWHTSSLFSMVWQPLIRTEVRPPNDRYGVKSRKNHQGIPKTDGRYTRRPIRLYRPAALRGIAGHQRGPYLRNFHL